MDSRTQIKTYLGEQNLYIYFKYLQMIFVIFLKQCSIAYISSSIELFAINNQLVPILYANRTPFGSWNTNIYSFSFYGILKSMCTNEKNYTYPERKQREGWGVQSLGAERERVDICGFRVGTGQSFVARPGYQLHTNMTTFALFFETLSGYLSQSPKCLEYKHV